LFWVQVDIRDADGAQLRSPRAGVVQGAQDTQISITILACGIHGSKNGIDFVFLQKVQ
jgi:hypothetical protein